MRVLVGYASAHGSTEGIATEIGDRLRKAGLSADVRSIDDVDTLDGYDAVVLGSAIHNMAWLARASRFVTSHAAELASVPVWLFSVSSVGDTTSFFGPKMTRFMQRTRKESKELVSFRAAIHPREHRSFAGAVKRDHWNLGGDLFMKAFGGTYGDHRDWQDVDAWSDRIAQQLQPRTVSFAAPRA